MYVTGLFRPIRALVTPGKFTLPPNKKPLVIIASDSGIALIRSISQELSYKPDSREFYVFFICTEKNKDFLYKKDIEEFLGSNTEPPLNMNTALSLPLRLL